MSTGVRLFRLPVCDICCDQVQDFVWVSVTLLGLVLAGFISGMQFFIEEVLVFVVLVVVKHRLLSFFEPFTRRA